MSDSIASSSPGDGISTTTLPARKTDTVVDTSENIPKERTFNWSLRALSRLGAPQPDKLEKSRITRKLSYLVPLPIGTKISTSVARVNNANNTDITHRIEIPQKPLPGIHSTQRKNITIVSSHENALPEDASISQDLLNILNSNDVPAVKLEKINQSGRIDTDEINVIKEHFQNTLRTNEELSKIYGDRERSRQILRMREILFSREEELQNPVSKLAAIKKDAPNLPILTDSINYVNGLTLEDETGSGQRILKFPKAKRDNNADYIAAIVDTLKMKFIQKQEELENKPPEIIKRKEKEAQEYEKRVNEATVELLKQSPLQRVLKLSNLPAESKLNLIIQKELLPRKLIDSLKEKYNEDPVEIIKALEKKAAYNTRQITSENNDVRSVSLYEKRDNHLEPRVFKKRFYLGNPNEDATSFIEMSWNIPQLEKINIFTEKALNLLNSTTFDELLIKLTDSKALGLDSDISYFNKVFHINQLKTRAHEAYNNSDFETMKESMTEIANIFKDLLKDKPEHQEDVDSLFSIAVNKLINIKTNDGDNIATPEEENNVIDKSLSLIDMTDNQRAGVQKLKQSLDSIEIVKATGLDIALHNVIRDIYDETLKQVSDREQFQASFEKISKINQEIIDIKTDLLKRTFVKDDLQAELAAKNLELNEELTRFAKLATGGEDAVSKEFAARIEQLIDQEADIAAEFIQSELEKQNSPEYQTDEQILTKYGDMAELASTLMAKSNGAHTVLSIGIGNNKGETLLKELKFNTDNPKVSAYEDIQIGDYLIPIPHADQIDSGSRQSTYIDQNSGYKVEVNSGGFMKISDKDGHTTHMVSPLGVEMQFSDAETPHAKTFSELKIKDTFRNKGDKTGDLFGRQLKSKLEIFQRGKQSPLAKSKAKALTPILRIINTYGGIDELEPNGKYAHSIDYKGKLTAFTDSPERLTATNVTAPRQVLFAA